MPVGATPANESLGMEGEEGEVETGERLFSGLFMIASPRAVYDLLDSINGDAKGAPIAEDRTDGASPLR